MALTHASGNQLISWFNHIDELRRVGDGANGLRRSRSHVTESEQA
jgi:hypothetical protein